MKPMNSKNIHFTPMHPLLKCEGKIGKIRLEKFTATEEGVKLAKARASWSYDPFMRYMEAGDYVRLIVGGETMMSDTPMERMTNQYILDTANGDVLIAGLGICMLPVHLLMKPEVRHITVVELSQNVIDLNAQAGWGLDPQKVTIVKGDIFEYTPDKKFDTIYFDIWLTISGDNYNEMVRLNKRYRKHLNKQNPHAIMTSWLFDYCKEEEYKYRREKRAKAWV